MMNIAALGALVANGRRPMLALEMDDATWSTLDAEAPQVETDINTALELPREERAAAIAELLDREYGESAAHASTAHTKALMLGFIARKSGLAVRGFDPYGSPSGGDVAAREEQMVNAASTLLDQAAGRAMLLSTGAFHVATLHDQLSAALPGARVVSLAMTHSAPAEGLFALPFHRSRRSWLYPKARNDEILLMRPTTALDNDGFNFMHVAQENGLLRRPSAPNSRADGSTAQTDP